MTFMPTYIAIVPARGGSKGVPRKNLRDCGGKPLLSWTLEAAVKSNRLDEIILSTDDEEIAQIGLDYNVRVVQRPAELASDVAQTEPVMLHVLDQLVDKDNNIKGVVLLQPTSPLRTGEHIDDAIDHFEQTGADSLVSVCENHHFFWKDLDNLVPLYDYQNRPRRQDIQKQDIWYRENGAIYISAKDDFCANKNRLFGKIVSFVMDQAVSLEIDSMDDLIAANALLSYRTSKGDG